MRRIVTARDQYEQLAPWMWRTGKYLRVPNPIKPGSMLDEMGYTPRKFNGNFRSWIDASTPEQRARGLLWYPVGHEWGAHVADRHDVHPDKVYGTLSKTSPQRGWPDNISDAYQVIHNHINGIPHSPLGGISGGDNLKQALRVLSAPDHPDHIEAAFLGSKKAKRRGETVMVPKTPGDAPKTYDFHHTLRDPEKGGAYNYMAQPGVVDSWMARSMMWTKDAWDKAQAKGDLTGSSLPWPGKGSGEGLDKPTPVKKLNEETGSYEVTGYRKPNARDVSLRVLGYAGAYDSMRNAMRYGAAHHDMPYTHGAQATVWDQIGGTPNEEHPPRHDLDLSSFSDPNELYNEMWSRRTSGLMAPSGNDRSPGGLILPPGHGQQVASKRTAHAAPEEYDTLDETWGTPEDHAAVLRHCRARPGWDHWEDCPYDQALREPLTLVGAHGPVEEDPWSGPEAEALDASCKYCGAGRAELCDPRCPSHHFYDDSDAAIMGGESFSPPDDLHTRLNSVQEVVAYADRILTGMARRVAPGYYTQDTPYGQFAVKQVDQRGGPYAGGASWYLHPPHEHLEDTHSDYPSDVYWTKREALEAMDHMASNPDKYGLQQRQASTDDVLSYSAAILKDATVGEEAMDYLRDHPGGITFKRHPGKDQPSTGYMVSRPHEEKIIPFENLSAGEIDAFHGAHPSIADPNSPDYYGGWHQHPDWYHDLSEKIEDSYDAGRATVDRDQEGMFDNYKIHPHTRQPLPDSYIPRSDAANSGVASAMGFTMAKRRRRR